jgi:hypothetical protein
LMVTGLVVGRGAFAAPTADPTLAQRYLQV